MRGGMPPLQRLSLLLTAAQAVPISMITHGHPSFGWQGLVVATWGTVPPVLLADLSLFCSFSSSHLPPLLHLFQQFFLPSCNFSCYFIQPWSSRLTAMLHTLQSHSDVIGCQVTTIQGHRSGRLRRATVGMKGRCRVSGQSWPGKMRSVLPV